MGVITHTPPTVKTNNPAYDVSNTAWMASHAVPVGAIVMSNFGASTAPTVGDDSADGYEIGSRWINTVTQKHYVCISATVGAAVWVETTGGSGGTPAVATLPGLPNATYPIGSQVMLVQAVSVGALPTLPNGTYPIGSKVRLTTDNSIWANTDDVAWVPSTDGKIYRNPDDVEWTAGVWLGDATGQLTGTQVADDAIGWQHMAPSSVGNEELRTDAVSAIKIVDKTVNASKITDGAINTPALAARLALTGKAIVSKLTGRRVELSDDGLQAFDAAGALELDVPVGGTDPISIVAEVEAKTLVVTGDSEFRGTNILNADTQTWLDTGVSNPGTAPTVTASTPSMSLTSTPANVGSGFCHDPAGGAGLATAVYYIGADPTIGNLLDLFYEYNATTGALLRTFRKAGTTTTQTGTVGSTSHVADTTDATTGSGDSQVATPLTLPSGLSNVKITKVSVYAAGYGGSCSMRTAIWNTSGTLLANSSTFTAASRTFSNGNDLHYDYSIGSLAVAAGATVWAGFLRTSSGEGFFWSKDDGSGKTTKKGDGLSGSMSGISTDSDSKPNVYLTYTYDVDGSLEGNVGRIVGVARVTGSDVIWILDEAGILYKYTLSSQAYLTQVSRAADITGTKAMAGLYYDSTAGQLIITTTTDTTASAQVKFVRVNASTGALVSAHSSTGLVVNGTTMVISGGYYDGANHFVVVNGVVRIYTGAAYAYAANNDFGQASECQDGISPGASAYGVGYSTTNPTKVYLYTSWIYTSPTNHWFCYTYYDATGTTHETAVSPRTLLIPGRRRQVTITTPAKPTGAAEPPDRTRIYMVNASADPGGAGYKLQATDTGTSRVLTTYNGAGAANPTTNNFPASTAAEIRSTTTGWSIKGDGTINSTLRADFSGLTTFIGRFRVGSTGFPGSPTTDDMYFRMDRDTWFVYDGTRWICTCLHNFVWPQTAFLSATTPSVGRIGLPHSAWGGNILIEDIELVAFVNTGGTALSASHKWGVQLRRGTTAQVMSSIGGAAEIASGTAGNWLKSAVIAVDASLAAATYFILEYDVTKTGTPGNIVTAPTMNYRFVG